jgi:hypothetical protein
MSLFLNGYLLKNKKEKITLQTLKWKLNTIRFELTINSYIKSNQVSPNVNFIYIFQVIVICYAINFLKLLCEKINLQINIK